MWVATRWTAATTSARRSADRVRIVPSRNAVSGMTLLVEPASMWATVTTAGSNTSTRRVTIDCSASTISAADRDRVRGGVRLGGVPTPPADGHLPLVGGRHHRPGPHVDAPLVRVEEMCSANAPLTGASGTTSSRPSSSMKRAPWKPSSPGCTMNTT